LYTGGGVKKVECRKVKDGEKKEDNAERLKAAELHGEFAGGFRVAG
jgi:hypothetical protein